MSPRCQIDVISFAFFSASRRLRVGTADHSFFSPEIVMIIGRSALPKKPMSPKIETANEASTSCDGVVKRKVGLHPLASLPHAYSYTVAAASGAIVAEWWYPCEARYCVAEPSVLFAAHAVAPLMRQWHTEVVVGSVVYHAAVMPLGYGNATVYAASPPNARRTCDGDVEAPRADVTRAHM